MTDFDARLARLEAESAIRQLVARYCFYIDDRDIEALRTLFTPDACLRSADGVMNARGVDAIINQFHGRFDALGPGHHFMHDILLEFTEKEPATASGRVIGHAELWRNNRMMVTALRYADQYQLTESGWKFAEREIQFLYYVPIEDYPGILGVNNRNLAYPDPKPADFPEQLASWRAYEDSRGRLSNGRPDDQTTNSPGSE